MVSRSFVRKLGFSRWDNGQVADARLEPYRQQGNARSAIVFVHGFGGEAAKTWGDPPSPERSLPAFPALLAAESPLQEYDIYSVGYDTGLAPDIRGIWSSDPSIPVLAKYLITKASQAPLSYYEGLVFLSHSMGGLVVQRALVDDHELSNRVTHLFFFGTPSGGLQKASLGTWFKKQVGDMAKGSEFIASLRSAWSDQFTPPPFGLFVSAGTRDDFVPPSSSLGPFPDEYCLVVSGSHSEIVKPADASSMSVRVVVEGIQGDAPPGGPWNPARVALQKQQFTRVVSQLLPHADDLDADHAVILALALDSLEKRNQAIEVLENNTDTTDVLGTLSGRYKRQWLEDGTKAAAERTLDLYSVAFEKSVSTDDHHQAYYHAINLAFMELAYRKNRSAARKMGMHALRHCDLADFDPTKEKWRQATIGEAQLYRSDLPAALDAYRAAVGEEPSPREMESAYVQACGVIELMGHDGAGQRLRRGGRLIRTQLDQIFRRPE